LQKRSGKENFPKDILFDCTICAECCRDSGKHRRRIIFSEKEAEEISLASGISKATFSVRSGRKDAYSRRMRKISGNCFFLNIESRLCRIYEKRPLVCRFYPFELREDGSWACAKPSDCEGLGRGEVVRPAHFRRLLKRAKEVFY